jgi:hypothetical protein
VRPPKEDERSASLYVMLPATIALGAGAVVVGSVVLAASAIAFAVVLGIAAVSGLAAALLDDRRAKRRPRRGGDDAMKP